MGPLTLWRRVNKRDWPISPRWFLAWQRSGVGACFHKSSPHEQPGNHFPEFSQSRTNAKDGRHGADKHSLRECHAMLRDLAHSWVTKTKDSRQPIPTRDRSGSALGPVCYPRTGVVEPCPNVGRPSWPNALQVEKMLRIAAELAKTEQGPISTSGASIFSMSPNRAIPSDKSNFSSPHAAPQPLTILS